MHPTTYIVKFSPEVIVSRLQKSVTGRWVIINISALRLRIRATKGS